MISFPNSKINLGLNVLSKRKDGLHNISSAFYPLPLEDALEVLPSGNFDFTTTGIEVPGNKLENIVVKAYTLLKEEYKLPPVQIHLHKMIPAGAGLGGGSADAAFMIKGINDVFDLGLTEEAMLKYAAKLGSDCPFFIKNKPLYVEGIGNLFSSVAINLKGKYLVLICPDIHMSTADAYRSVNPRVPDIELKKVIEEKPLNEWKLHLINDFETVVFSRYPEIMQLKEGLYEAGALFASMSGSGSSVYGIFDEEPLDLPLAGVTWRGYLP